MCLWDELFVKIFYKVLGQWIVTMYNTRVAVFMSGAL